MFYAESWALTHYLLLGNAARRPQLSQMFRLMQDGATQEDAFNDREDGRGGADAEGEHEDSS